ncbi:hypothetical protein PIB30_094627 [Stylosanthes scabra]|uniref:Uncharacterized protein n=1 Tax=Stylosanthes scabra TaxID=79078 RepID=A0ABU6UVN8_9FABA|nr:hypothetical protein [Stylosanthes scabra]
MRFHGNTATISVGGMAISGEEQRSISPWESSILHNPSTEASSSVLSWSSSSLRNHLRSQMLSFRNGVVIGATVARLPSPLSPIALVCQASKILVVSDSVSLDERDAGCVATTTKKKRNRGKERVGDYCIISELEVGHIQLISANLQRLDVARLPESREQSIDHNNKQERRQQFALFKTSLKMKWF